MAVYCVPREDEDLFADIGDVNVVSWLPNYPIAMCLLDEGTRKKLLNKGQDVDTILAMCCESGQKNVAKLFPDKELAGAMNAKGLLRGATRKKLGKFFIDEQTVDILRYTPESSTLKLNL